MTLTPEQRAVLRALAAAASPGPWRYVGERETPNGPRSAVRGGDLYAEVASFYCGPETARYIAAASPDVATALLDRIDALECELRASRCTVDALTRELQDERLEGVWDDDD